MKRTEREPYDFDMVEIGPHIGYITQLTEYEFRKKKNPIGFSAPKNRRNKELSAGREAGTFPDVPRFDIRETEDAK